MRYVKCCDEVSSRQDPKREGDGASPSGDRLLQPLLSICARSAAAHRRYPMTKMPLMRQLGWYREALLRPYVWAEHIFL